MSNSPTLPPITHRKPTPLPGLATESDARLQAALAASARAEVSLNGLFRSIQNLGSGVGGAREANESLTQELEALRDMLGAAGEQQMAFKQKVALLEQALDRTRKESERDRAFLIEQQDAFLVILIDEQEAELRRRDSDLETLRGRVAELERRVPASITNLAAAANQPTMPPPAPSSGDHEARRGGDITLTSAVSPAPSEIDRAERAELERTAQKLAEDRERARETVQRLQAQRDEAQSAVARITKDRDDALQQVHRLKAELGGPRISSRPPSAESRRDSASFRAAAPAADILTLEGLELEARLARPVSPSQPAPSSSQPGLVTASSREPSVPPRSSAKPGAPISSVLNPPRSNPLASSPLPTRLSPPPTRLSPLPAARNSQPPEELRRALTNPPASTPTSSKPVLKQKPDASTRPLVGYSMGNESVETEHVRLSSKPPRSDKR
ncbi:MAG TPA: hypothetical protein VHW01_12340 [Polyangiaceae bacterium]|nr:hypothetical protein [Polyangiaceae bacterium]